MHPREQQLKSHQRPPKGWPASPGSCSPVCNGRLPWERPLIQWKVNAQGWAKTLGRLMGNLFPTCSGSWGQAPRMPQCQTFCLCINRLWKITCTQTCAESFSLPPPLHNAYTNTPVAGHSSPCSSIILTCPSARLTLPTQPSIRQAAMHTPTSRTLTHKHTSPGNGAWLQSVCLSAHMFPCLNAVTHVRSCLIHTYCLST